MNQRVWFIVGPTGIGKTGVSLELAKRVDLEVVSADSRQIYKFMDIGTAKPTRDQLAAVPHHFVDIKCPDEYYSAGQFGREAHKRIQEIFSREKQPLVVGGSGLYIRALVDGLFEPQIANAEVKAELRRKVQENGITVLHEELTRSDPATAARLNPADTQRIVRALEVFQITGQPFSKFLERKPEAAAFDPYFFGITMDRPRLYARIEARVDAMLAEGLVDEVKDLRNRGYGSHLNAMQTVGYKEAFSFLREELTYDQMVPLIKQKTRNYAKRQLTWFRVDKRINWLDRSTSQNASEIAEAIHESHMDSVTEQNLA